MLGIDTEKMLKKRTPPVYAEFELWNEPSLSASNYLPYATLANWTYRALHAARVKQGDRSHLWKPRLFYGTMSGQYASSGPGERKSPLLF